MKSKTILLALFLLVACLIASAQVTDFRNQTSLSIQTQWKKWDFSGELETRQVFFYGNIRRSSLELEAAYTIAPKIKAGFSYSLIDFYDEKYTDYQLRQRFSVFAATKLKTGNFSFSLREKLQYTYKDESGRIKSDGETDTYSINPEWTWRNKLKAEYNIPHFKLTPYLSLESFYQLNNPEGNAFCDLRYTLGGSYKFNRQHKLEIGCILNKQLNSSNPKTTWMPSIGYTFSF